jgi:adenylyltransferase/sulfurtransferase
LSPSKDSAGSRIGSVIVVGVGGLGAAAALELANRGIGRIELVDRDRVEVSNLHRQILFDGDDVGQPKAAVAARKLARVRPTLEVSARVEALTAENGFSLLVGHDVVIDATDDPPTKFLLNDLCVRLGIPLVHAGVTGLQGQVLSILPGRSACLRCLFPEAPDDGETATCRDGGVLGPLPAWIGSLQAEHAMRILAGTPLAGRMITVDARSLRVRETRVGRSTTCPVCSDAANIGSPAHDERGAVASLRAKEMS